MSANSAATGGGLLTNLASPKPGNTIIAGNTATTSGPDVSGTVASQGHKPDRQD